MASTPYQTTSALTTVVAPGAIVGQSQTDTVSFFGGTGITGGNAALTNVNLTGLTAGQTGYTDGWTAASFNPILAAVAALLAALNTVSLTQP